MITRSWGKGKEVLVFQDPAALAEGMAAFFVERARRAVKENGRFVAALSGGATPALLFQRIADLGKGLDLDRIHMIQADERFAPTSHPDSNQGMIIRLLVKPLGLPAGNFHAIPVDAPTPREAAAAYEAVLKTLFGPGAPAAQPDLALLGMGQDGHTASLFPDFPSWKNQISRVLASQSPGQGRERVTLSLPFLLSCGQVVFLATGENKAQIAADVLSNKNPALPASRIWQDASRAIMALDRRAAGIYLMY